MTRVHEPGGRGQQRGFTLIELMVALSGGLMMAVFVFMLASQGSRFYRREARVANATIGVVNGFQRLRADIARASFLSSPNIVDDPYVCRPPSGYAGSGLTALANLAGFRLTVAGSYDDATDLDKVRGFWDGANLKPDSILLAGSYTSVDEFLAREVVQTGGSAWRVVLQANTGSMARLGYRTTGGQTDEARIALLSTVFAPGRVLRIIDKKGWHHYGIIGAVGIDSSDTERAPYIDLTTQVPLVQDSVNSTCGLEGLNKGAVVNVVNFIRYRLERLKGDGSGPYDALYDDATPYEDTRTELVRTEMQPDGVTPFAGTQELVAEYAVDFKFGVTGLTLGAPVSMTRLGEDDGNLSTLTGLPTAGANPQLIRAVHARLAVRSREGDRDGDVPFPGLYRVPLNEGQAPFARVRTLQADIALRNNYGARW